MMVTTTGMQLDSNVGLGKRARSSSLKDLCAQPEAKHFEACSSGKVADSTHDWPTPNLPGEQMSAFFRRLGGAVNQELFRVAHSFNEDGLYLYKRPVRSNGNAQMTQLLQLCGSVMHHCVVYIKRGEQLECLEFGPANNMDITTNWQEAVAPGPIRQQPAPAPEAGCLPMLHMRVPHHALEAEHVQRAVAFCERSTKYHALQNNCIAFADFLVQVLTGGAVRGAPLIFDALAGSVPPADHPMLAFVSMALGATWHAVTDGSRLLAQFLQAHPAALVPLPEAAALQVLLPAPAVLGKGQEGAASAPTDSSGDSADTEAAVPAVETASSASSSQRRPTKPGTNKAGQAGAGAGAGAPRGLSGLPPRTRPMPARVPVE